MSTHISTDGHGTQGSGPPSYWRKYRIKPILANGQRLWTVQRRMRWIPIWVTLGERYGRDQYRTKTFRTVERAQEDIDELLVKAELEHYHKSQAAKRYP